MKRGVLGVALCVAAAALTLNGDRAAGQGGAIAKSKGWAMNGILKPADLQAAGNKPIMLVFR